MVTELSRLDPTWLSMIHEIYQSFVEKLLNGSDEVALLNVDPQHLRHFRSIYGGDMYRCRYLSCTSSTNGFSSRKQRDQHETSHVRRYKCVVQGCTSGYRGFRSQRDLKLHCQKYHSQKVPELILEPPRTNRHGRLLNLEGDFRRGTDPWFPDPDDTDILENANLQPSLQDRSAEDLNSGDVILQSQSNGSTSTDVPLHRLHIFNTIQGEPAPIGWQQMVNPWQRVDIIQQMYDKTNLFAASFKCYIY